MSDIFPKEKRSAVMKAVKSRNTKTTELKIIQIFKELHITGWRRTYPLVGKPDFVFPRKRIVVFVDGCFWHGHEGCKYYVLPKTNVEFWKNKIERNRSRDIEERQQLTSMGWHCITIWECQLKPKVRQQTLDALEYMLCHIYLEDIRIKSYETTEEEYGIVAEPNSVYR